MSKLAALLLLLLSGAIAPGVVLSSSVAPPVAMQDDAGARDPLSGGPDDQLAEDDGTPTSAALRERDSAPERSGPSGPLALLPIPALDPPPPPHVLARRYLAAALRPSIHVATRGARAPPA